MPIPVLPPLPREQACGAVPWPALGVALPLCLVSCACGLLKAMKRARLCWLSATWTVTASTLRNLVIPVPFAQGRGMGLQHRAHASVLADRQLPTACLHPEVPLITVGCCCCHLELSIFCKMHTRRDDGYWPEGKRAAMEDRYRDFPQPDHRFHDLDHRERGHYQEHVIDR